MFQSYRNESLDLQSKSSDGFYMMGTLVVKGLKKIYWNYGISSVFCFFFCLYIYITQLRKQFFIYFHATRQNSIKIMFLIKFQEYFEKMYSCSGAFKNNFGDNA